MTRLGTKFHKKNGQYDDNTMDGDTRKLIGCIGNGVETVPFVII